MSVNASIAIISLGRFPDESDLPSDALVLDSIRSLGVITFSLVGSLFQSLVVLAIYSVALTVALSTMSNVHRGDPGKPGPKQLLQVMVGGVLIIVLASGCFGALFAGGVLLATVSSQVLWIGIGAGIGGAMVVLVLNGTCIFGFLILNDNLTLWSSLWHSWTIVKPHFRSLLGMNALVLVVSSLTTGAGILVAMSLSPLLLAVLLPLTIGFSLGLFSCTLASAYANLRDQSNLV